MTSPRSFNRLILRAVLRKVSPMVIRVFSVPDDLDDLWELDEVFRAILDWDGLGFMFRIYGEEFNSFRRRTRTKVLRDFRLRPRETFLYTCGAIDLWEWEFRVLDLQPERTVMMRRSVWPAGVRHPRSTVAAPPVIG